MSTVKNKLKQSQTVALTDILIFNPGKPLKTSCFWLLPVTLDQIWTPGFENGNIVSCECSVSLISLSSPESEVIIGL